MKTIRLGTFETNSSSCHSVMIMLKDDWEDFKNHKKFINEHVKEKLTLNKVAEVFNISPNYLSILFSKYNDYGFTQYINQSKIEAAKKMMSEGNLKIYEISDLLGYESAFYFSRVFKKVAGVSPREYINQFLST